MLYLHVNINLKGFSFTCDVEGVTYHELVEKVKERATPIIVESYPRFLRGVVRKKLAKMNPLSFAQECVKKYNKEFGTSYALPADSKKFVEFAVSRKFATLETKEN